MSALAGGKQSAAEFEPVNLTLHSELATLAPEFEDVKRYADDGPVQAIAAALQHGFKNLDLRFAGSHSFRPFLTQILSVNIASLTLVSMMDPRELDSLT